MAETIQGYNLPVNVRWLKAGSARLGIGPGGEGGTRIGWDCDGHVTFQVQYRERKRFSPSGYTAAGVSPAQDWTEWTAWTDPEDAVADDTASSTSKSGKTVSYTAHGFAFPYDITTYDMYNVDVRVRVFDRESRTCSPWVYARLSAVIRPQCVATAEQAADGTIAVTCTATGWERGGNVFRIVGFKRCEYNMRNENLGPWWGFDQTKYGWANGMSTAPFGVRDGVLSGTVNAPRLTLQDGRVYATRFEFVTGDGGYGIWDSSNQYTYDCAADDYTTESHVALAVAMKVDVGTHVDPPSGVDVPTVTVTDAGDGNLIATVTGGTWDGVSAWYEWDDARGVHHVEQIAMGSGPQGWKGRILAPPYDVPVTVTASVRTGNLWMTRSASAEVASHGVIDMRHLTTGEALQIHYNARQNVQRRYENEVDVVKPAGAARPKSRYGTGGTMSLSITGNCPQTDATLGWLHERSVGYFAQLEVAGDWLLRLPGGERYTVALTGYTLDNADMPGFWEVGLELEVVE
jgi:hypothetical protein